MAKLVLDIFKPEQVYGVPNGGTVLVPLNDASSNLNVTYAVDDESDFNFGSTMPELVTTKGQEEYGETQLDYTRPDHDITLTVMVTANDGSSTTLKNGVRAIQAALSEATAYGSNQPANGYTPKTTGLPYFLRYQTDSTVAPVYFKIKSGMADTSQFENQVNLLGGVAYIPVTIRVSYAAYGPALYLDNCIDNGSGSKGFKYWWVFTPVVNTGSGISLQTEHDYAVNDGFTVPDKTDISSTEPTDSIRKAVEYGVDALYGNVTNPEDTATYFRMGIYGQTNLFSAELRHTSFGADSTTAMGSASSWDSGSSSAWTNTTGTWGISSANGYSVTDADGDFVSQTVGNNGMISGTVLGDFGGASYRFPALCWRYKDASNYCNAFLVSTTVLRVRQRVAGVNTDTDFTLTNYATLSSLTNNTQHTITILATATNDYIFLDQTYVGAVAPNAALVNSLNNKVGFMLRKTGTPAGNARIAKFYCSAQNRLATQTIYQISPSDGGKLWGGLEYRTPGDSAGTGVITVKVQTATSQNSDDDIFWTTVQTFTGNAVGNTWTQLKASNYYDYSLASPKYVRLKIYTSMGGSSPVDIRKVACYHFPYNLSSDWLAYPTTEFISQTRDSVDTCIVTGLRGDIETNPWVKVVNPTTGSNKTYQELRLGVRKQKGNPGPFVINYNSSVTFNPASVSYSNFVAAHRNYAGNILNQMPFGDFKAREYNVIMYGSTTAPCGVGLGGLSGYTNIKNTMTIVPNASVRELPNTAGVDTFIDCGVVSLPPYNASSRLRFMQDWNISFSVTPNTGTSSVTVHVAYLLFIPAEQSVYVDTRAQGTQTFEPIWINDKNRGLVIDSLLKEVPSFYFSDMKDEGVIHMYPKSSTAPVRFFPATKTSPYPMLLAASIRQVGTNGNPATTHSQTDPVHFVFIYCPAYEF